MLLSIVLSFGDCCCFIDMVPEDADHSRILHDAIKNKDVFHVTSQEKADVKTWRRMLQDELLEAANDAKVKLHSRVVAIHHCS